MLMLLDLGETQIGDNGLKNLGKKRGLARLSLDRTKVTVKSKFLLPENFPRAFSYGPSSPHEKFIESQPFFDEELHRDGFPPMRATFSPDGRYLAFAGMRSGGSFEGELKVLEVETGKQVVLRSDIQVSINPTVFSLGFSPDGRWFASMGGDSSIDLWNPTDGFRRLGSITGVTPPIERLAFTLDNEYLFISPSLQGGRKAIRIMDRKIIEDRGEIVRSLKGLVPVDRKHVIAPSLPMDLWNAGNILVLSLDNRQVLASFLAKDEQRHLLGISENQEFLAYFARYGAFGELPFVEPHPQLSVPIAPTDVRTTDQMIAIWQVRDGSPRLLGQLDVGSTYVSAIAISEDGKTLAALGGRLRLWRLDYPN